MLQKLRGLFGTGVLIWYIREVGQTLISDLDQNFPNFGGLESEFLVCSSLKRMDQILTWCNCYRSSGVMLIYTSWAFGPKCFYTVWQQEVLMLDVHAISSNIALQYFWRRHCNCALRSWKWNWLIWFQCPRWVICRTQTNSKSQFRFYKFIPFLIISGITSNTGKDISPLKTTCTYL